MCLRTHCLILRLFMCVWLSGSFGGRVRVSASFFFSFACANVFDAYCISALTGATVVLCFKLLVCLARLLCVVEKWSKQRERKAAWGLIYSLPSRPSHRGLLHWPTCQSRGACHSLIQLRPVLSGPSALGYGSINHDISINSLYLELTRRRVYLAHVQH